MGINIGFTGTRDGMTVAQKHQLRITLKGLCTVYDTVYFHHGAGKDRQGGDNSADMQAARIAEELGCIVVPHPPKDNTAKELLARDDIVVEKSQELYATPGGYREIPRGSGTWATVRRGRKTSKSGGIIWPCGCMRPLEDREHHDD